MQNNNNNYNNSPLLLPSLLSFLYLQFKIRIFLCNKRQEFPEDALGKGTTERLLENAIDVSSLSTCRGVDGACLLYRVDPYHYSVWQFAYQLPEFHRGTFYHKEVESMRPFLVLYHQCKCCYEPGVLLFSFCCSSEFCSQHTHIAT